MSGPQESYPTPPAILRDRPLIFGDLAQIAALHGYEQKIAEIEEERADLLAGIKRVFEVEVEVSGYITLSVVAKDRGEARTFAEDMWNLDELDHIDANYRISPSSKVLS